jgi:HK97 family phage prohead protease
MPYFVTDTNPDCEGWAVEKEDGEVVGCHRTRQEAIDQMVAISLAEDIPVGGERSAKAVAPREAQEEARRGLAWREEYGRGGTEIGVARARDIANGRNLSDDTIRRMVSYFARHEVDKQGQGWSPGEDGYPSAGRIAWALWGGDPGRSWAERVLSSLEQDEQSSTDSTMKEARTMQVKSFPVNTIEVKAAGSAEAPHGEFTALVSVFGNTDLVGDRVMPGAFAKSLSAYTAAGKTLPIVWSHDWGTAESFIGKALSAQETTDGLLIRGAFFDTPRAQTVRTLLAERVVSEFSFAYDIIQEQKGADGVNELLELSILEAGPTLKGANPATQLIAAKSAARHLKAEPGELTEGSWVEWDGGYGRVEYIMTEGTFGVEGDALSPVATPEDPLALVRIYQEAGEEYTPTDLFTAFRFSELETSDEKRAKSISSIRVANAKAGRTLSTKNEGLIQQAKSLLDEVLSSLETPAEPAKTEEPTEAKVEERGMEPGIAVALLDLEEVDAELP